jgi:hypothetical protein
LNLERTAHRIEGALELPLVDLASHFELDADGNGELTWGEVRSRLAELDHYFLAHLRLATEVGVLPLRVVGHRMNEGLNTVALVTFVETDVPSAAWNVSVEYHLLFDQDAQHRGLARLSSGDSMQATVFRPDRPTFVWEGSPRHGGKGRALAGMVSEGIWHIWLGLDHVLFLLSLLFPVVWARAQTSGHGPHNWRLMAKRIFQIVTAFTVAHSLTLALAAFELVRLSSRWLEGVIAASVVLAALNNLRPVLPEKGWVVAFVFGLVHGFGFAGALSGLDLAAGGRALALLAFNVGVELGQLALVVGFLCAALPLRRSPSCQRLTLACGSTGIALVAGVWMCERCFDFKWLPF